MDGFLTVKELGTIWLGGQSATEVNNNKALIKYL